MLSAVLRGICDGKVFKHSTEYHIIQASSSLMLKCEALSQQITLEPGPQIGHVHNETVM